MRSRTRDARDEWTHRRSELRRPRRLAAVGALACALLLVGCAAPNGGATEPGEPNDEKTATDSQSAGICEFTEEIAGDIELATMEDVEDPASFPARMASAADRFASIDPPEEIAREWQSVEDLFTLVDETLQGKEIQSAEDLREALSMESEEAFFLVLTAPGFMEVIGVHLQQECGADLGLPEPVVADPCEIVDTAHLVSTFASDVPAGDRMRWAGGVSECSWKAGDSEVALVIGPAQLLRDDILSNSEPIETVQADPVIEVFDGALGPFRLGSGRTALGETETVGILVSVRSGDARAEADQAVALVGLVAADIG